MWKGVVVTKSNLKDVALVVSVVVALGQAIYPFIDSGNRNDSENNKNKNEYIGELHRELEETRKKREALLRESVRLETELLVCLSNSEKSYAEAYKIIANYIEDMPYPAWAKIVEDDGSVINFRMAMLNKEYEKLYGISRYHYVGKLDRDIWGEEIAKGFWENDNYSYQFKIKQETIETFPLDPHSPIDEIKNPLVPHNVVKWVFKIGSKWAVGGIAIPIN